MKTEYTSYAVTYTTARERVRKTQGATWLDVARAYDAGLTHGIDARGTDRARLERYLRALRIVNAPPKARMK